jgi:hypothetical protein
MARAVISVVEPLESRLLFTTTALQIDSGGPAVGSFVADGSFSGGSTYSTTASINTSAVASPAPQQVYQTERYGNNFSYVIPNLTAGDQYSVILDFAEIYYNAAGQRQFNVSINGTSALSDFDIYAAAGGKNKAIAENFTETADINGNITIAFANITGGAKVDGIEISGPTTTTPSPTTSALQIDAGGPAAGSFVADTDFSGGSTYSTTASIGTSGVTSPAPQQVYETERYGQNFSYLIPGLTPGDQYTLTLDFDEIYYNSPGQRLFNVSINGAPALSDFDIYTAAGGMDKAIAETFTETADTNGQIIIAFANITGGAKVDGIEISGSITTTPTALQIDAGGPAAGSFAADEDFSGGSTYSTTASIDTSGVTDPAPQSVYQTERYGDFSYTLDGLNTGSVYSVRLDFDEIYWDAANERLFDVSINGTQVLNDFDIFAVAGGMDKAIAETFNAVAVNGKIVITFSGVTDQPPVDQPKVDGIEITPVSSPAVTGFTLVNADTGSVVGPLTDHETIDTSYPSTPADANFVATTQGTVGSVVFALNGTTTFATENSAPYGLFGPNGNLPLATYPGTYAITATPYSGANGTGVAGTPYTVHVTVGTSGITEYVNGVAVGADGDLGASFPEDQIPPGTYPFSITNTGTLPIVLNGTLMFSNDLDPVVDPSLTGPTTSSPELNIFLSPDGIEQPPSVDLASAFNSAQTVRFTSTDLTVVVQIAIDTQGGYVFFYSFQNPDGSPYVLGVGDSLTLPLVAQAEGNGNGAGSLNMKGKPAVKNSGKVL